MKKALTLFFCCTTIGLLAQGPISGFLPEAGGTDIALSYGHEYFSQYYFGTQKQQISQKINTISVFVEHGLSAKSSLILAVPYMWIGDNKGLQDGSLFLKFKAHEKESMNGKLSLIGALGSTFPLSKYSTEVTNPIGARATLLQGRLVAQFNSVIGAFASLQTGLDVRVSPNTLTALPVVFRVGYGGSWFYMDAWLEYYHTFNAGSDATVSAGSGSTWFRGGGTLYYPVTDKFGAFLGFAQIFSGRNIGLSSRWNLGLVWKL